MSPPNGLSALEGHNGIRALDDPTVVLRALECPSGVRALEAPLMG